ncbi:vitamin K epoxide reductase family protein [Helcobacillus massiliensis]
MDPSGTRQKDIVNAHAVEDYQDLDAEIRADMDAAPRAPQRTVGLVLLIGGFLGWWASVALTLDKFTLLKDPHAKLGCDVNPFISCGTMLNTWQASTFGIPNPLIGIGGFAIMAAVGALMMSRVLLPRWFEWAVFGGVAFSFAFIHWLAISAIFFIHALCPWCLVAWVASAPMFFSVVARLVETGHIGAQGAVRRVLRSWVVLTLAWYLLVIVLIVVMFWNQWVLMFGL